MLPYHINSDEFERAYKEKLSGFESWEDKTHAEEYMSFPENVGVRLCIDETSLWRGEIYTIVSNPESRCRKGSLVAVVKGTKSDDVIRVLKQTLSEEKRLQVREMTLDFSPSMERIAHRAFPTAVITIDRFHVRKGCMDAMLQVRSACLWEARRKEAGFREIHKRQRKDYLAYKKYKRYRAKVTFAYIPEKVCEVYQPLRLRNGDTVCELLTRSYGLLMTSSNRWTASQKERAELLFQRFPRLKEAYWLTHSLRMIFSNHDATKEYARESFYRWYWKVMAFGDKNFTTVARTIDARLDEVLNYFVERHTNAYAESLNSKIKAFRASLRGVTEVTFFFYRLKLIFA